MAECQRAAAEYAARYAFMVLDADRDGLIGVDELLRFELFASYGQTVVERIHAQFDYSSGFHGHLNAEDFIRLNAWTEDRDSKRSQNFWFRVVDVDGDGVLSVHDMKWLYDQIWKDEATCVSFEDLVCQVYDMAGKPPPWRNADFGSGRGLGGDGVTMSEIRKSRLAPGIFGVLLNHNDMLLRRSTAEFSKTDVPM